MGKNQCLRCCKIDVKGNQVDVAEEIEKIVHFIVSMEREQLKIHGLTVTQCRCIIKLSKCESITMNDISEYMQLDKSTMTRIIGKLVENGYVEREKSTEDKRSTFIQLTEIGKSTAIELRNMFGEYYTRVVSHIPYTKIDTVIESLFIFLDAFKKAKQETCGMQENNKEC